MVAPEHFVVISENSENLKILYILGRVFLLIEVFCPKGVIKILEKF